MELVKENKKEILSALQRALQKEFDGTEQQKGAKELIKSIQNYGIYPMVPELELYCWDAYGKYGDDYSLYPDEDFGYFIVSVFEDHLTNGIPWFAKLVKRINDRSEIMLKDEDGQEVEFGYFTFNDYLVSYDRNSGKIRVGNEHVDILSFDPASLLVVILSELLDPEQEE